ncbi:MAG: lamin tail domain-containing protein, partial [Fusobacteria bacterium]|nr:lamin tail domain-containing protein [Fusobacteriota bacterium]
MKKFNYIYRGLSFVFVFVFSVMLLFLSTNKTEAALSDLFISEYVEGSSNNKALEIYNGTGGAIDLAASGYSIKMFFNGSTTPLLTVNLNGVVESGDVFVLVNSSASSALLAYADQTGGGGWFNGNDAVALYKGATLVDCIGRIGQDPGSAWVGGGLSTVDRTLVRKSTITSGDINPSDAFDPSFEWIGYPIDTFNNLGSHTIASYTVTFDLGDHGSLGSGTLIQTVTYGSGATAPVV